MCVFWRGAPLFPLFGGFQRGLPQHPFLRWQEQEALKRCVSGKSDWQAPSPPPGCPFKGNPCLTKTNGDEPKIWVSTWQLRGCHPPCLATFGFFVDGFSAEFAMISLHRQLSSCSAPLASGGVPVCHGQCQQLPRQRTRGPCPRGAAALGSGGSGPRGLANDAGERCTPQTLSCFKFAFSLRVFL